MNMPLDLDQLLLEECNKLHTNRKDYIVEALRDRLSKPHSNAIGIVYGDKNILLERQQQLQPTIDEQLKTAMRNFDTALERLLPFISFSQMDVPTFLRWKKDRDSRIFKVRNPKYVSGNSKMGIATASVEPNKGHDWENKLKSMNTPVPTTAIGEDEEVMV